MNPELKLENVSVGYKNALVKEINAHVPKGKLTTLLGENGSGKTTLFKSVLGLTPTLEGTIFYGKKKIQNLSSNENARIFSVVLSRMDLIPNITVKRLLMLGRIPYHGIRMKLNSEEKELIEQTLILTETKSIENKFCNQLSDGQLQKVLIARALVQNTPIVLMDEPTAHLDLKNRFKIFNLIKKISRETNKTFLITTHEIQLALQMSDWIWYIKDEKLYSGFPEEVAMNLDLYNHFSTENISYDYQLGRFQINQNKNKSIHFIGDQSHLSCWIEHALMRLGFQLNSNASEILEVKNNKVLFRNKEFASLKELLEFLE